MKIAFVGKGGSGKTTLSWIFSQHLSVAGKTVLAIDADHNMDLSSLLGVTVNEKTPTIHRFHDAFRKKVGLEKDGKWSRMVLEDRKLPHFTVSPPDEFTSLISIPVGKDLKLIIVGLGSDDILYSEQCAHGHSAPLKYYLPLLREGSHEVIIDSVAGTDMLNFGLYAGVDLIVVAVESHRNSIKVAEQIKRVADRIGIPMACILNKPQPSPYLDEFIKKNGSLIIGEIPDDAGISGYAYSKISPTTTDIIEKIWHEIKRRNSPTDTLVRLKNFEYTKQEMNLA